MLPTPARRAFVVLLVLALLGAPASATWSIVIVNTVTGEVGVACATCLTGFDLEDFVPVIVPGVGGGAAQSQVGPVAYRQLIRDELLAGTPPAQILLLLDNADFFHQSRQYGIVDVAGGRATFTGNQAGAFAGGVTGQVGDFAYAIQGNVITGPPVLASAEAAILNTPGDLIARLSAGMEAARLAGGDGRCSCAPQQPTACGSPPPSFTKSSHIAFMISARPGDVDAPCNAGGCAEGTYYMNLNVAAQQVSDPDPVLTLQSMLAAFRNAQLGRPDHFLSSAMLARTRLPADGVSSTTCHVDLADWQGTPLTSGGATVTVNVAAGSTGMVGALSPVVDNGDGTYDFAVTAGALPGAVTLEVSVDDGLGPVRISPDPVLTFTDPFGPCGDGAVNDDQGPPAQVLRVNGSAGVEHTVTLPTFAPLTFAVDAPPGLPAGPTPFFILWARVGTPGPADALPLGDLGTLCFLPPGLPGADASTVTLANAWTPSDGLFPSSAAPWSFVTPGVPVEAVFSLQGLVIDDAPFELAVTNAVSLRTVDFPAPAITAVTPASAAAGTSIVVDGTGFQSGATVDVGGIAAATTSVTPTSITLTMPAGVGCDETLVVTNPDAQTASTGVNATPVITSTAQASGPAAGGAPFFVIGQHMLGVSVTIGGAPATVVVNNDGVVGVQTPPGSAGVATVIVTSPVGCTATTIYTYL